MNFTVTLNDEPDLESSHMYIKHQKMTHFEIFLKCFDIVNINALKKNNERKVQSLVEMIDTLIYNK